MRIRSITTVVAGALLLALAACTPGGSPSAEGCEELAAADVLATGASHFTDTGPFTLTVDETAAVGDNRATVLTSVDPSDAVGYDPLLFFSECRGGEAVLLGVELTCRLGVATKLNLIEGGWIFDRQIEFLNRTIASDGTSGPRYREAGPMSRCVSLNHARANASAN